MMARYDDESYTDEDAERDELRQRRRDSLMQRRLRAARGEEADEGMFEEYDEPPPPRYRAAGRPRYSQEPLYGAGGGGCASAILYVVLGAIAVLLIVLLFGQQLFNRLVPDVPSQIRQVVATPTTTLRDRGGTILQIRGLNRLETQSYSVERVIEARVERNNPLDLLLGDRLLLIAAGDVIAGVDLSKLRDSDVTISQDGKSITLKLPPSEIFSKRLDNDRTRVYDRQTGILAPRNPDLETQARQQAEVEILSAACESGIMQRASNEAQRSMEQFLKLLDFESVTVVATAGPCVAPAAGPAPSAPTTPTS